MTLFLGVKSILLQENSILPAYSLIHLQICLRKVLLFQARFFAIRQKKMDAARIGSYLCGSKKESNSGFISSRKRKFVCWRQVRNGNNGAPQSIVVTYSYKFLDILKAEILPRSLLSFLYVINYYLKVVTSVLNLACLYKVAYKEMVGQSLDLRRAASLKDAVPKV